MAVLFFIEFFEDVKSLHRYVNKKWGSISLWLIFTIIMSITVYLVPSLLPVLFAALLIKPLHFLIKSGTTYTFDEDDWYTFSPFISNLSNYRFIILLILTASLPLIDIVFGSTSNWQNFGGLALVMTITAIFVFVWSEGFYRKNFYFKRWHPLERSSLIIAGALVLTSPLFVPIFLVVHRAITTQFNCSGIAGFNWTHSELPERILLIMGSAGIIGMIFDFTPLLTTLLLLSGWATNYFHAFVAKISKGPIYYVRNNNPANNFLNAYKCGWFSNLSESTVLDIGRITTMYSPILVVPVLLIQGSTLFVLTFQYAAIPIAFFVLIFHLLVFLSAGDNFWKWMATGLSIIISIIIPWIESGLYGHSYLIALISMILIISGPAWAPTKNFGWLDSPYLERNEFIGYSSSGEQFIIDPGIFAPYDARLVQGTGGTLDYLSELPRVTHCLGSHFIDKSLHRNINNSILRETIEDDELLGAVNTLGECRYNGNKKLSLETVLNSGINSKPTFIDRLIARVSSPREFYTTSSLKQNHLTRMDLVQIDIYRIDGIWKSTGFTVLRRELVLTLHKDDYNE